MALDGFVHRSASHGADRIGHSALPLVGGVLVDQRGPGRAVSLGLSPDGVLRFGIAVAAGPREHRRLDLEFEQVLLLTRRWHGRVRVGALFGELLC
jgi:hypothetical protein